MSLCCSLIVSVLPCRRIVKDNPASCCLLPCLSLVCWLTFYSPSPRCLLCHPVITCTDHILSLLCWWQQPTHQGPGRHMVCMQDHFSQVAFCRRHGCKVKSPRSDHKLQQPSCTSNFFCSLVQYGIKSFWELCSTSLSLQPASSGREQSIYCYVLSDLPLIKGGKQCRNQQDGAAAGVNVMFLNGLPVDVPAGMELYPLLERISAEVHFRDYCPWYTVAAQAVYSMAHAYTAVQ